MVTTVKFLSKKQFKSAVPAVKQKKAEVFVKACMNCKSPNIKIFWPDDNDAFGLNPKYECLDCGHIGLSIEINAEIQAKK